MKLRHLFITTIATIVALSTTSCKKDGDTVRIDKSLINGQWICGYYLVNHGLDSDIIGMFFDFDVDNNKFSSYLPESENTVNTTAAHLEINGNHMILQDGEIKEEYTIVSLDQIHMIIQPNLGDDYSFSVVLFKMNSLLLGTWAITWDMATDVTHYYRFDKDGKGARVTSEGEELQAAEWWIEPATSYPFKFTISVPSGNYENTISIFDVLSDNKLKGEDEAKNPLRFNRLK